MTHDAVPMPGVALLIPAAMGYILMGQRQREAREPFDDDAGYRSPDPHS